MRLRIFVVAGVAAALALALACGSKEGSSSEIPIGEYGSLTGGVATFGVSTPRAPQLALYDIKKKGGVLGKQIKLYVEDDQSKPEEAATVVTKLINQQHVVAVLG